MSKDVINLDYLYFSHLVYLLYTYSLYLVVDHREPSDVVTAGVGMQMTEHL